MKREIRTFSGAQLRAKSDKPGASGYAAVFNQTADLGWFKEVIKPGAFSRALQEKQDVRCLQNHDENMVLGRTKSNTLTLLEDATGLQFDCNFPDTMVARDLHTLLKRKDVDQCSFGFVVRKQTWSEETDADGNVTETREIEDVDLFDVSIVTYPAYEGTSAEARSLWPDGAPAEVEQRTKKRDAGEDKCQCDCPECQQGDCMDCSNTECDDPNCAANMESNSAKPTDAERAKIAAELAGDAEPSEEVIKAQLEADRMALEADQDRVRYTQTAAIRARS